MEEQTSTKIKLKDYEIQIGDTYKLDTKHKIAAGAFGDVFEGQNVKNAEKVAIKLERVDAQFPQLFYESKIYMSLQGGVGIPNIHWCGNQKNYNILIIDLLGPTLENLFNTHNKQFTLKTVLQIGDQILQRIEFIHSRNFVHRDITPENFACGNEEMQKEKIIYIFDFGLSKRYRDPKTGLHINYKDNAGIIGCIRYCSINALLGLEQGRRDDMEAIGYMLVYFMKGKLPWQGIKAKNMKDKFRKLKERKLETTVKELCTGLPDEFQQFLSYAREIQFEDKPDYHLMRRLLKQCADKNKIKFDGKFDWIKEEDNIFGKDVMQFNLLDEEKDKENEKKERKKKRGKTVKIKTHFDDEEEEEEHNDN